MVTRKYTGCTDYGKNVCYFLEVLEALTYELSAMIASTTASSIYHAKIISMLMSTLAKVLDLGFCLVINHSDKMILVLAIVMEKINNLNIIFLYIFCIM
jgi:hypothetical protein